jgi:hypothetical protein
LAQNYAFGVPYLDVPPKAQPHNQEVVRSSVSVLTIFSMKNKLTEHVFQLPTSVNATPTRAPESSLPPSACADDTLSSPSTLTKRRRASIASLEKVKKQKSQAPPCHST